MISNSNELTPDFHDDDLENFDDPDTGFELDKLEIPKPPVTNESTVAGSQTVDIEMQDTPKSETSPGSEATRESTPGTSFKKGGKSLFLMVISGGLIALLGIVGFIATKLIQPDMTTVLQSEAKAGTYHPIEPIITNLGHNHYVTIVLMLRSHSEQSSQFMALKSKVIDAVFNILGSEDFQRQVAFGGSAKIKSVLYNEISALLDEKYPNQAILSEVRLTPRLHEKG